MFICLICTAIGLWFVSPANVWPTSVAWLNHGDMAFAQNMWQYFRYSSIIQWPLTAVPDYGYGWGSIYPSTAGVVLVGLPFKLLSPILPEQFQFLGLWTVSNFVLQGYFSERLFRYFGLSIWERFLGVLTLLASPVFIFRIGMTHLDLSAHWLILAALLVYVSGPSSRRTTWQYLLPLTALLVNIYLFVIVIMISVAGEAKHMLIPQQGLASFRNSIFRVLGILSASVLLWWVIGYSTFLGSARGEGFFRINALAFFNPQYSSTESFSLILNSVPLIGSRQFFSQEGEGFAYIGLVGIVAMFALLVYTVSRWPRLNAKRWIPITGTSGFLFLIALSNRIAVVRQEVTIAVPEILVDWRQVFRAANRFSWLAYYLLLVLGWVALTRLTRRFRFGVFLLAFIVTIGSLDQREGILEARSRIANASPRVSELAAPKWREIGESVSRMYLIPTFDVQSDSIPEGADEWLNDGKWSDLIRFGAEHRLTTNFAYVGRPVTRQVEQANSYLAKALADQMLPRRSVLFFASEAEWISAQLALQADDFASRLGNYFIIVTGG